MQPRPAPTLRTAQFIPLALMVGMVLAVAMFVFMRQSGRHAPPSPPPPSPPSAAPAAAPAGGLATNDVYLIALGVCAISAVPMAMIVSGPVLKKASADYAAAANPEEKERVALMALSTVTTLRCATFEGVGLMGAVVYMVTGLWPVLIAPALALLAMLALFPTRARLEALRDRLARRSMA